MNDFGFGAKGPRCYKQLRVMDYMPISRSHELRALNTMNNLGFWVVS